MLQIVKNVVNLTPQIPLKKIKGSIFFDSNNNGALNNGEPFLSGWEIKLDGEGKSFKSISDQTGNYLFDSISPGIYTISLTLKSGWQTTFPSRVTPYYTVRVDTLSEGTIFNFGVYTSNAIEVSLSQGWNIISLPVKVTDNNAKTIFPTAISNFFFYNSSGYSIVTNLENGNAYFVKFPYIHKLLISGELILSDTIDVLEGWNFIGSISKPISVQDVITIPPGIIASDFWYQNSGYVVSDSIRPGIGYWLKTSSSGKIILKAN
ncbi:MAG: Cell surface protein [Ignavibacteriae bacterium]|nr:MAG: Cell surface protein [Ignavibacteriota bacterium]